MMRKYTQPVSVVFDLGFANSIADTVIINDSQNEQDFSRKKTKSDNQTWGKPADVSGRRTGIWN